MTEPEKVRATIYHGFIAEELRSNLDEARKKICLSIHLVHYIKQNCHIDYFAEFHELITELNLIYEKIVWIEIQG